MKDPFSAVLLAGGQSTRMGRNKALLSVGGQPLWERQLNFLRSLQPAELFLAAPAELVGTPHDAIRIDDAAPNAGPLAGLVAALRVAQTPWLLALAVDLPAMSSAYLRLLLEHRVEGRGAVPQRRGRLETLAAVYPIKLRSLAEGALAASRLALRDLARDAAAAGLIEFIPVPAAEERLFVNLNTLADWTAWEAGSEPPKA